MHPHLTNAQSYPHSHIQLCTYKAHMYRHAQTCTHMHRHVYTHTHTYTDMHIQPHIQRQAHTNTHIHRYAHIQIYKNNAFFKILAHKHIFEKFTGRDV